MQQYFLIVLSLCVELIVNVMYVKNLIMRVLVCVSKQGVYIMLVKYRDRKLGHLGQKIVI